MAFLNPQRFTAQAIDFKLGHFSIDESTRWRYTFDPTATGTRVTERYEVASLPTWVKLVRLVPGMPTKSLRDGQRGMQLTLQRLKSAAEV